MNCRLMGRIWIWTLATTVAATYAPCVRAADGDASSDKTDHVDLATQHAAKVNAALLAARRLEREGLWRQAAAKYSEVLQLMPRNEQASPGYQQAMAMLDKGSMLTGSKATGATSVEQQYQEQRSRATVEFEEGYARANQLMSQEDFAGADRAILTAQIKLRQRKQYLSQGELESMNTRAEDLISVIGEARVNARLLAQQAATQEAESSRASEIHKAETEKAKIITENLIRVRTAKPCRFLTRFCLSIPRILRPWRCVM